jgi:hypothetical protein
MPRAKRKPKDDVQEQQPAAEAAQAADTAADAPAKSAQQDGEQRQWTSKLPDPHGHIGTLVSTEGHRVRLLLGRQYNQQKIMFTAPEGKDPKPDRKYIDMMHEMGGWTWRASDKTWDHQLLSRDEKAEVDGVKAAQGDDEAKQLRQRYQRAKWLKIENDYRQLVATMRQDAGMPASELIGPADQTPAR